MESRLFLDFNSIRFEMGNLTLFKQRKYSNDPFLDFRHIIRYYFRFRNKGFNNKVDLGLEKDQKK